MNKIEKLIKEMCPNGVEYKKIKDIAILYNGLSGKTKNNFNNQANSKYITYLNVFNNLSINVKELENVQIDENEKQNKVKYGDVLFTGSSETAEECGMSSIINFLNEDVYLNSFCFGLRVNDTHLFNIDFLKYLFRSDDIREKIIKCCNGVTRFNLSKSQFQNICIPIPPIEIQNEIVKILDTFTQLEAELEAELEARDKQYQYYRNKLLDFDNNQKLLKKLFEKDDKEIDKKVKYEKLGGVVLKNSFQQVDANYISSINCESGDIKLLPSSNNYDWFAKSESVDDNLINNGEVITLGRARYANIKYWNGSFISSNNITITSNDVNKMLNKFLYYFLVMNNEKFYVSSSTYPKFDNDIFDQFLIPIPSLEIQTKIVNILDKLQDYSKDIKTGLPLEIEQRQKQYEYYRNLLLDFKANAQGGALANRYTELLNSIYKELFYSFELKQIKNVILDEYWLMPKTPNFILTKNENTIPYITSKNIKNGVLNFKDAKYISKEDYKKISKNREIKINDILVSMIGTIGEIAIVKNTQFYGQNMYLLRLNEKIINIKYFLIFISQNKIKNILMDHKNNSPQQYLKKEFILELEIPIPSLEVQNKIVEILEKLYDYSKNLKDGLPLEIEQRKKQYRYYRNLLLKF